MLIVVLTYGNMPLLYMQSNKIHNVLWLSLLITLGGSTCFGPQWSILRSVYKLYVADLVCGNLRTIRYVQMLCGCKPHNIWTYRVVRKLPHTKSATYSFKRSWGWTIEVRNMSNHQVLLINSVIKHCVSCWITYILQDDTRSIQYQVNTFITLCTVQNSY